METLLIILENPALMTLILALLTPNLANVIAKFTSNEVANKYLLFFLKFVDLIAMSTGKTVKKKDPRLG